METEITNKLSGWKKTFYGLIIFVSAFIVYYSIMSIMSPLKKLASLKEEYRIIPDKKNIIDERTFSDSAYLKMFKQKAFLQARIAMAETDSIYLTLNLVDSTANIEISGVVVHAAKMSRISASKILTKGNENIILSMLATPFTISNSFATIKKEPVMLKMAPKDTSEYKPDIMPDTSITEPVNYVLEMTNGTRLYIYQEDNYKSRDRMSLVIFDLKDRLRKTLSSLKDVAVFKVPEYHPYVKLRLPRADAKIIYRAIPENGQIAVFM
ncbi:MAG: hypothetical protein EPN88_15890 [Bacteroidetes bacterium]|nr:MAG: hypothetical protein EPN88_15890 [Bacteroidota bacterium]